MTKNTSTIKPQPTNKRESEEKKTDINEEIKKQATRNGTTRHNLF